MSDLAWKRVKEARDDLLADQEAELARMEQTRRKLENLRRLMGKKTPLDVRSDPVADDEIFKWLYGLMRGGLPIRLTNRWRPGVIYGGLSKDLKKAGIINPDEDELDPHGDGSRTVWVPAWKHTGFKLKTFAWAISMVQSGKKVRTLNLNLGLDVIDIATAAKNRDRPLGFARIVRERITKRLKTALKPYGVNAPDFFFWVEARNRERAHLHGMIFIPDHPEPLKIERVIRAALKAAGGDWNSANNEKQLMLGNPCEPAGWARYISKWRLLTRIHLQDDNTVAATGGVRSPASDWYEAARASGDIINS